MIVDGPLEPEATTPRAILEGKGHREVVSDEEIQHALGHYLSRGTPQQCISSLLVNTQGGLVARATPIWANIDYLKWLGVQTTAFVKDQALSCGGEMFARCGRRIGLPHTTVMWHQVHYHSPSHYSSGNTSEKPRYVLANKRSLFRRELAEWLAQNVRPERRRDALRRAKMAFEDPDNHLDDVKFNGEELHAMGLMDYLAPNLKGLALHYAVHTHTKPADWHPLVQDFFGRVRSFTL